jgi:putative membrane protein
MEDCPSPSVDPRVDLAEKRTGMASMRVRLALERTTLAWIRTALTMVSFGFGVIGFFRPVRVQVQTPETIRLHQAALKFGYALPILGIAATVLCALSHWRTHRCIRRGELAGVAQWPLSITLAALLPLAGVVVVWELLVR